MTKTFAGLLLTLITVASCGGGNDAASGGGGGAGGRGNMPPMPVDIVTLEAKPIE